MVAQSGPTSSYLKNGPLHSPQTGYQLHAGPRSIVNLAYECMNNRLIHSELWADKSFRNCGLQHQVVEFLSVWRIAIYYLASPVYESHFQRVMIADSRCEDVLKSCLNSRVQPSEKRPANKLWAAEQGFKYFGDVSGCLFELLFHFSFRIKNFSGQFHSAEVPP